MAFQVLIVDDEPHARTNLRLALASLPDWVMAAECSGAAAARAWLQDHHVDLLMLDVQMPVESGIELARTLSLQAEPPLIVFVTAHRGHALDAFDVHALDYLVKPIDERRLYQALERARAVLDQRATYARALRQFTNPAPGYWRELIVRSVGSMERVTLDDVWWLETAGNYVELHLPQRVLLHRTTLTELVRYLDPAAFLRIHRRILVRRGEVLALRQGQGQGQGQGQEGSQLLVLRCGRELPVSERYLPEVKSALVASATEKIMTNRH